ncbi:hypothetical protein SAMN02745202_00225 [Segatella oulorum]|uniref:Uncharacterized protein n=1 Tax=Segatella oulorum TaxID=28136 RepID=A0A1T4KYB4_9BACT|nr:hypothetical protein SAMN02745202_00225 [Segatella oulorum]
MEDMGVYGYTLFRTIPLLTPKVESAVWLYPHSSYFSHYYFPYCFMRL